MVKHILLLSTFLFVALFANNVNAQDPQYSQFYAGPLYLNPALTGTSATQGPRIVMNYRNQWPSISGTFTSYMASYDQPVRALSGGAGLLVTTDKAGEGNLRSTDINLIYAYEWNINRKSQLRVGLEFSYFFKSIDFFRLVFPDQLDPQQGIVRETSEALGKGTVNNPDFSAGLLYFQKYFYVGITSHHLNEPTQSLIENGESSLPRKFTAHAGGYLPINKRMSLHPAVLLRKQDRFDQFDLGMYLLYEPIMLGLWWRTQDAIILLLGVKKDNVAIGYSYDLTTSDLRLAGASSHELSFSIELQPRVPPKRFKRLSCPSFGR